MSDRPTAEEHHTDASTHGLREDAQRLLGEPACLGAHVRDDGTAELEYRGSSLAPALSRQIADLNRHILDVTPRTPNTVHVEIQ